MAKLMIWAGAQRGAESSHFRPGDIVGIREDDSPRGVQETPGNGFVFLQLNGVPKDDERLLGLVEPDWNPGYDPASFDPEDPSTWPSRNRARLRLWFLRRADLPQQVRNRWLDQPNRGVLYISVPGYTKAPASPDPDYAWSQLRTYWRNKRNGQDRGTEGDL